MTNEEMQEQFMKILEFGYQKGEKDSNVSVQELLEELSDKLRRIWKEN
ncbi:MULTISPECIES: hypothetical protein [Heyndrickxia]|nr:hypothetical protein [Weizmannia sp. CD-2023]MEC2222761.1 hypothetical protein [Weizmannia sp. CD-2023]MED4976435.1 hypothetical protein [Weizmannia sp. CD-2023]